jgi:hypothetical protein
MVPLTLKDIQSSLRLNVKLFDIYLYSLFCVIDVPQFNQFHKMLGLLRTISRRFLTYFEELSTECFRNTVTDHRANEHDFLNKKLVSVTCLPN